MPTGIYKRTEFHRNILSKCHKGIITWNKGLTKETDIRLKKMGKTISKIQFAKNLKGSKHWSWRGGKHLDSHGYPMIYMPNHPRANHNYVFEHWIIMEEFLGRYLKKGEEIHHINGNPSDNRIENLKLFPNHSEHSKTHYPKGKPIAISWKNRKHFNVFPHF